MSWAGNIINQIKAYTIGTDSIRVEEINPLSQQFVSELLVSSAVLQSGASPFYYPSTAGAAAAGFKDISFDYYLLGNAGPATITMTIEGTSDDVTPFWHGITMAGYNLPTNAAGAASYASVGAVALDGMLDFDEYNGKLIRVKTVVSAAFNCTARIYMRRKAL